ncbi:MAG TPA: hypothetical protein VM753_21795, partial [Anaeromyxobacter sp.]|nr:hypothetical protein [Anaeromyxobacter sp.]
VAARLLAARDALPVDREAAKALLAEAVLRAPRSAAVHAARAEALAGDPTLDDQVARARCEAELREALAGDPGDARDRLLLASLLRQTERLDDAEEALGALPAAAQRRGDALEERARVADARGLVEQADALVREALDADGECSAADLGYAVAGKRGAVAEEDARMRILSSCRDGANRLAAHLVRRGDPRRAAAALAPLVEARPWSIDPALARADALVAAGDVGDAARAVEALRAIWPRSPRLAKRLADLRELGGDPAAARALRERALLLDGADLALRRALALDGPGEVLDDLAEGGRAVLRAYREARPKGATSAAMVLDAAEVEIHPGGAATERTHQIFHVIDQQGVEQLGEVTVPPGADVLTLRTLKPDGRTLEPERTGSAKGSVSLAGLEPGDFVDVEYLRAVRGPDGSFVADPFFFRVAGTPLFRSSYVVAAPAGTGLRVDARNMPAPAVAREGGRDVVRGLRTEVPALVPEPNAVPMSEYLPFLRVGVGGGRDVAFLSVADAAIERTRPTEEIRALAREIRAAAGPGATPVALVRAAYVRVTRTILGSTHAYSGEDASAALSRGRGSRLLVLKAVLAELGLRARLTLARPFPSDPDASPLGEAAAFSQPLLRVEAGGETLWLDPAERLAPFGALPPTALDVEAVVLPEPGERIEATRTPAHARVDEERSLSLRVLLREDGGADLEGEDRYVGALAGAAKGAIERLDGTERRQAVEAMLSRSFPGFAVSEVAFAGEEDPEAPLVIRWKGRAPDVARAAGDALVVDSLVFPARLSSRFVQVAARTTTLLIPSPERAAQRIEIVAPRGFTARPEGVKELRTPFGTFTREERANGGALVREEKLALDRARVSPERYRDFAAFAAAVDAAQARPAVFSR